MLKTARQRMHSDSVDAQLAPRGTLPDHGVFSRSGGLHASRERENAGAGAGANTSTSTSTSTNTSTGAGAYLSLVFGALPVLLNVVFRGSQQWIELCLVAMIVIWIYYILQSTQTPPPPPIAHH